MYQKKNELKNLIYIQENKPCNEQTVKGLFRSIVEPLLEENSKSLVLCRLENNTQNHFAGILKRLEYSNAEVYDFSKEKINEKVENVLKNEIWGSTEFLFVLSSRFGAVLIFDYEESEIKGLADFYVLYNSKNLSDAFDIINSNSTKDFSAYAEEFRPDRRDNNTLNLSVRKIVEILNETSQEVLISEIEKEKIDADENISERFEFLLNKSSYVAHEIRNQLSICNLYSTIIQKRLSKISIENEEVEESINNALDCIQKSVKIANTSLMDLKSLSNTDIQILDLDSVIKSAIELAKVYVGDKKIEFNYTKTKKETIMVDENKFLAVLINLLKNAIESISEFQEGKIELSAQSDDEKVKITIANNGKAIEKELQAKIFEEGFTTKKTGSGLGLHICKKSLEEQFAQLRLVKSDDKSTEFEVTVLKGGL